MGDIESIERVERERVRERVANKKEKCEDGCNRQIVLDSKGNIFQVMEDSHGES